MPRLPKKCYRPIEKSKARTFKTCDAGRIAAEVVRDGNGTREEVMRCVAKSLGYSKYMAPNRKRAAIRGALLRALFPAELEAGSGVKVDTTDLIVAGFVREVPRTRWDQLLEWIRAAINPGALIGGFLRAAGLATGALLAVEWIADLFSEWDILDVDLEDVGDEEIQASGRGKGKRKKDHKRCYCDIVPLPSNLE